jgi:long-chain acyl-CoA synthetase
MDWSRDYIPAMQLEPRFGDRVVPVFGERPQNL